MKPWAACKEEAIPMPDKDGFLDLNQVLSPPLVFIRCYLLRRPWLLTYMVCVCVCTYTHYTPRGGFFLFIILSTANFNIYNM